MPLLIFLSILHVFFKDDTQKKKLIYPSMMFASRTLGIQAMRNSWIIKQENAKSNMPGDPINGDKSIRVTVVTDNVHRHFVLLLFQ